jgi:hypothetical protein
MAKQLTTDHLKSAWENFQKIAKPVASIWSGMSTIMSVFDFFFGSDKDEQQRQKLRKDMTEIVGKAKQEIITQLMIDKMTTLKGEIEGFENTFAAYDPDPSDPLEENRLVRLIDDSSRVLGQLGQCVDLAGPAAYPASNSELAFQCYPLYLTLTYLRVSAMVERELTYGAEEIKDAIDSFAKVRERTDLIEDRMRAASDARFGNIKSKENGEGVGEKLFWWYVFDGKQYRDFHPWSDQQIVKKRMQHQQSVWMSSAERSAISKYNGTIDKTVDGLQDMIIAKKFKGRPIFIISDWYEQAQRGGRDKRIFDWLTKNP